MSIDEHKPQSLRLSLADASTTSPLLAAPLHLRLHHLHPRFLPLRRCRIARSPLIQNHKQNGVDKIQISFSFRHFPFPSSPQFLVKVYKVTNSYRPSISSRPLHHSYMNHPDATKQLLTLPPPLLSPDADFMRRQ
ncbi:unnamed protein product [Lactuca virosa]|uniref:Uncharacterized protein n=1 Tax=Lactuca virosa TaxID=75947 RepID=A0AAU9LEN2_9ASTR|nr:unnamed protein product [Lactuca virosa]